ncbi:hypothetical protein F9278_18035 [Streptomyces phaeolivaceus]|uniref:Uncharacterized protein n=1 Tax=Streptomyces phaeolivaceus TaxID=2653200 RepID=A0A5P8K4U0_9ACTN|nr:hypothetical protein [Streptomyces phaeolivaceus]QFQ97808.1 hypothetical protein F9278_18035 [Streptomyces phaeolivaceus]
MTNNEGEAWGGVELDRAEAELRQVLAVRMQRAVPADLVVTTRTEIEKREFRAYGQGWRDRGEHEEQRSRSAAPHRDPGGKILPFPQQTPPPAAPPHPHPHPHPPTARPHPSDDDL